jgi:Xaa-Pro aminopeptidase
MIDGEPLPVDVRQARMTAVVQAAREADLSALVVFSHGARANVGTHGHLRYLLDYTSDGPPAVMVLPVDTATLTPMVGVTAPYDPPWMRELCPFIDDVRLENEGDQGRLVRDVLAQRGIRGRIGLVGTRPLDHRVFGDLTAPAEAWSFVMCDDLLHRQRMQKDKHALARMSRAAEICDTMFEELGEALRITGWPVWRAQALLHGVAYREGAETSNNWVVAGVQPDRTRGRREENMASIEIGQRVVASVTMTYAGYYGHVVRTYSIGDPIPEHERAWHAVAKAQVAMCARLHPGNNAREVPLEGERVLFDAFPEAREGDRLRFQPTHFIGLDYAEYPTALSSRPPMHDRELADLGPLSDFALQADMTIELHPNVCPPNVGLAAVGDIFVVGPNGGRRLTRYPSGLHVVSPR